MKGKIDTVSTTEASRLSGAHPVSILQSITSGRLRAQKDANGRWRIEKRSLEDWWDARRRRRSSGESVAVAHAVRALAGQSRKGSKSRGKGSKAENVRQPSDGESIRALRSGPPNNPSHDSWTVNAEEPTKS